MLFHFFFFSPEFLPLPFYHQTPSQDVLKHPDPNISNSSTFFPTLLPHDVFGMETQSCIRYTSCTFKISYKSRFFGVAYKLEGVYKPASFTSSLQLQLHLFYLQVSRDVVKVLNIGASVFFPTLSPCNFIPCFLLSLLCFLHFIYLMDSYFSCKLQFYTSPPLLKFCAMLCLVAQSCPTVIP